MLISAFRRERIDGGDPLFKSIIVLSMRSITEEETL